MQLQPQNPFTLVRQIPNHLDTATYYVRAVVRDAYSDTIIATLNLVDKGGQRFKFDWQVPADPSGQGFYISVITSVYTDSGYTTKSENYGDDENTYLVQDRIAIGRLGGQGGGSVDAFDMRRIINEELDARDKALLKKKKENKEPEIPWQELLDAVNGIEIPEQEEVSLEPILSTLKDNLSTIVQAIENKETLTKADLSPVTNSLTALMEELRATRADHQNHVATNMQDLIARLTESLPLLINHSIQRSLAEASFDLQIPDMPLKITSKGPEKQPKESLPFDVNKLSL